MTSLGEECLSGSLHRQVLDLENALRRRTDELQDATRRQQQAEARLHELKASRAHEAAETRALLQDLRSRVNSQEHTISSLKRQLSEEGQHRQTANPKCPLVGDPDWPEQLDEEYVAKRVPLGARTFAATLLQHVRMVQRSKEGQLQSLRETIDALKAALERERDRADTNAKLVARMHRELERLSGQVPRSVTATTQQEYDVGRQQQYASDTQKQHDSGIATLPSKSPAEGEVERTMERIKSMFSPQRWLHGDAVTSSLDSSPISTILPTSSQTFSLDSPGTPALKPHLSFSPSQTDPLKKSHTPPDLLSGVRGTDTWQAVEPTFRGTYTELDSCCGCKQDGPPLL